MQLAISRQVVYQQQLTLSIMLQHAASIQQQNNTNTNITHTFPNSTLHDSNYIVGEPINDTDSLFDFSGTSNNGLYSEGDIIESVRYALDTTENNMEPLSSTTALASALASSSAEEEERPTTTSTITTTTNNHTNNNNINNNVVPITFV